MLYFVCTVHANKPRLTAPVGYPYPKKDRNNVDVHHLPKK
jgi:hypothetical protein